MNILQNISNVKILVAGDVMLDRYWWGKVDRISPEAPVPIVRLEETSVVAGGAANVAANLAGLGAKPILFGVCGSDEEGNLLANILSGSGIDPENILTVSDRRTTVKTRIVAHSQQVVRIDQESSSPITEEDAARSFENIRRSLGSVDALILSDYGKGFLTPQLVSQLIAEAQSLSKPVFVDPKGLDFLRYKGATVITPNKREAADACSLDISSSDVVDRAGATLLSDLELEAVLITEGENGMTLFRADKTPVHLNTLAKTVFDVTGAGDTVIATFCAAVASGLDFASGARLANAAAGLVVGRVGTTGITREMLTEYLTGQERFIHA